MEGVTSAAKKILEHALTLPEDERQRLGEALLDSVPRGTQGEIQQAWVDVARRRAEAVERGDEEGLDLDQALAELRVDLRRIHQG